MRFEQYYLECLSQASYLIGDTTTGLAAVVDPRRDVEEYVVDAADAGLRIAYVIETHFHADFLSGHLELAAATGAEIIYGAGAGADFAHREVTDGERLSLGEVVLEFRATPGHTPESISIVVWEHADDEAPYGVLTGDALFIGDVGRPDLLVSAGASADELARQLYRSLHERLLTLPDATRVFPAHGAGSACGKSLSTETVSTIGAQRRDNYALAPMSVDEFVAAVTEGQQRPPDYFAFDAGLNQRPHALLDTQAPPALTLDDVLGLVDDGAVVLDARPAEEFARGHLVGSVNVGDDGRFAEYAGTVIDPDDRIVLVTAAGREAEARVRLGRIGFDHVVGVLDDPLAAFESRPEVVAIAPRVTARRLQALLEGPSPPAVIDIRSDGERAAGQIPGAIAVPLAALRQSVRDGRIPLGAPLVVHCAGGYRSSIAASYLRAAGVTDVSDLQGGFDAWRRAVEADAGADATSA